MEKFGFNHEIDEMHEKKNAGDRADGTWESWLANTSGNLARS